MVEITAGLVKELREKSGVGMMDCKRALQENNGDIDASMDWLRTKGLSKAAKKSDRVAAEGVIASAQRDDGKGMTGALVEFNAETDFVARNDKFQAAGLQLAKAALDAADVDALQAAPATEGGSLSDMVTNLIATIGENMMVRRMARLSVAEGAVASYIHNATAPNLGRIGVLVAVEGAGDKAALTDLGRKVAMHVAATQPLSLSTDDLDPAAIERERAILTEKAREEGRPDNMIEKIVEGQISKFQREVVLLKQPFVMNPDQTVEQMVAEAGKTMGSPIRISGFVRLGLGEGVEKKTDDFAAEVAAMTSA